MSWFYAISFRSPRTGSARCPDSDPRMVIDLPGLYIAAGGPDVTCRYATSGDGRSGWIVAGVGLDIAREKMFRDEDWRNLFSRDDIDVSRLDGHFALLRWSAAGLEIRTDQLGLRTVYYASTEDFVCCSTRLDWTARTCGRSSINFSALGNRWLLFDQLGNQSWIEGVERVGTLGRLDVRRGIVTDARLTHWVPDGRAYSAEDMLEYLAHSVATAFDSGLTPNLSMSGGFDSRVILAFLAANHPGRFVAHTFGHRDDPDVVLASRIAARLGFPHTVYGEELPEAATCIDIAERFVAQNIFMENVWYGIRREPIRSMHRQGRMSIDGALGALSRRWSCKRLDQFHRRELMRMDVAAIMKEFHSPRPPLFNRETLDVMEQGVLRDAQHLFAGLPSVRDFGSGNWLDLFTIRTNIPTRECAEQSRLDGEVLGFMPFTQPTYLHRIFARPMKDRESGVLLKRAMRELCPELTRIPLATSFGRMHPFGFSKYPAWMWTRLAARVAGRYVDRFPDMILFHLKEFVLDTLHSRANVESAELDLPAIENAATRFYRNEPGHGPTLTWWLTYELWKKGILNSGELRVESGE